jgi:hypothetical protein
MLTVLLLLLPPLFASASPDHQITVTARTVDGKPLDCIYAILYKAAVWDAAADQYVLHLEFEASGVDIGSFDFNDLWNALGSGGSGEYNSLSQALDEFALDKKIPAQAAVKSAQNGGIVFSGLDAGLYLVSQREYPDACADCNNKSYQMKSELVPLPFHNTPAGMWIEQVQVFPKIIYLGNGNNGNNGNNGTGESNENDENGCSSAVTRGSVTSFLTATLSLSVLLLLTAKKEKRKQA